MTRPIKRPASWYMEKNSAFAPNPKFHGQNENQKSSTRNRFVNEQLATNQDNDAFQFDMTDEYEDIE